MEVKNWKDLVNVAKSAISNEDLALTEGNADRFSQSQIDAAYRIANIILNPESLITRQEISPELDAEIKQYHNDCDRDSSGYIRLAYFVSENDDKESKIGRYLTDILPKLSFEK